MMIVPMNESHVPHVAELEKICFSDPWSEKSVASELNNSLSCWLVAEENGVVTGYVGSQTVIDESDMMNVAVHPDHRRKGIAEALVVELVEALKKQGLKEVKTGEFGAEMQVELVNDGPITLVLDSEDWNRPRHGSHNV